MDMGSLQKFRDDLKTIDPRITGRPITTLHSFERITSGFHKGGVIALLLMFAVLWLGFGRFRHACAAMTPSLVGASAMLGALGWLGVPLNPANLVGLPLILGIGVDYGVHVLRDYRGSDGRYELRRGLGKALVLSALTTILSFASLTLAPHWGMVTVGFALSMGVACCAVLAVLFLPAVLACSSRHRPASMDQPRPSMIDLPSTVYYREAA